jgi:hypothetical protein
MGLDSQMTDLPVEAGQELLAIRVD